MCYITTLDVCLLKESYVLNLCSYITILIVVWALISFALTWFDTEFIDPNIHSSFVWVYINVICFCLLFFGLHFSLTQFNTVNVDMTLYVHCKYCVSGWVWVFRHNNDHNNKGQNQRVMIYYRKEEKCVTVWLNKVSQGLSLGMTQPLAQGKHPSSCGTTATHTYCILRCLCPSVQGKKHSPWKRLQPVE